MRYCVCFASRLALFSAFILYACVVRMLSIINSSNMIPIPPHVDETCLAWEVAWDVPARAWTPDALPDLIQLTSS